MAGLLYLLLSLAAGAWAAGLLRVPLRLEERVLAAALTGLCLGGTLTFLVALAARTLGAGAAFAGPLLLLAISAALWPLLGGPHHAWMLSARDAVTRWRSRRLWGFTAITVAVVAFFVFAFHHALFTGADGSLRAGWENVWSDWSLHSITASSFAYGSDFPVQNPVYAGTPQLYPFMPDFQSAVLMSIGWSLPAALSFMSGVVAVIAGLLVVCIAERLTGSYVAGVVALTICLFGTGLAFTGVMTDACAEVLTGNPYPAEEINSAHQAGQPLTDPVVAELQDRCSMAHLAHDPRDAVSLFVHSLARIPAVLSNQPRAYDTDLDSTNALSTSVQWYTPFLAWWLPQRSFLYGFAITLTVLMLLWVALSQELRAPPLFALAGLLGGLLPLFHVHSLFTLAMVLPFAMWRWRERWPEWAWFAAPAVVVSVPRLLQLVAGPHGIEASHTNFPRIEVGWLALSGSDATTVDSLTGLVAHPLPFLPSWWAFWIWNTGVLLPLTVLGALALGFAREGMGRAGRVAGRTRDLFGAELLRFTAPFLLVFAVANVVVFQSWDWDNTKLFMYWLFAGSLLVGALAARWWRAGWWRAAVVTVIVVSVVATGVLTTARLVPDSRTLTVAEGSAGEAGFGFASASDIALAATIRRVTAPHSVVLTPLAVNDPALTLAGRTAVMGYDGWLFSYGIDYSAREQDVKTMYAGCEPGSPDAACPVFSLLRRYHVDYAEIWDDTGVGALQAPGQDWWAQHFPVVARNDHIVVYDVRGH